MFCRNCGAQIPEGNAFCENCGTPVQRQVLPLEENPPDPGKKKKRLILIAVIAVLAVCAGAVTALLANGHSPEYEDKLDTARQYVADERYDDAEAAYTDAIAIEPAEEAAYLELCDMYLILDRREDAIAILERGKAATGKERKFEQKIKDVDAKAGSGGKDSGGDSRSSEPEKRLKAFSDYLGDLFAKSGDPHAVIAIDDAQYITVFDTDGDGVPEYVDYSLINADTESWQRTCGFCTVVDGKPIGRSVEALYGQSYLMNGDLYIATDGAAYYLNSKDSGDMSDTVTISIRKYVPSSKGFQEDLLCEETCGYDDAYDKQEELIRQYIPADAVRGNSADQSEYHTAAWCNTLTEAAGFLSMYGITPLPEGSYGNDWKKAYQDYFEQITDGISFGSADGERLQAASEDVNGDGVPELFLNTDTDAGTVNSGTGQCLTFARGRVMSWPDILAEPALFKGSGWMRIDETDHKIYYNGLTGGYGNTQTQYILRIGSQGFAAEEAFESGWTSVGESDMFIRTTHNFQDIENSGEEISSIFSDEEYQALSEPGWKELAGTDALMEFIKGL